MATPPVSDLLPGYLSFLMDQSRNGTLAPTVYHRRPSQSAIDPVIHRAKVKNKGGVGVFLVEFI
jgi:hypothetical protein